MYILGIGGFMHDYNCCLVDLKNQKLAMCEAERLSRRKHHTIRPEDDLLLPIKNCCEKLKCRIKDIEIVVFSHTDFFQCKNILKTKLKKAKFIDVDHHLCHAAAAFFASPYDEATIVSIDGFGDGSSGLLAKGKSNKIEEIQYISDENSIGLEYLRATVHLGLGGYGSEGKTQGLAAYGEPTLFQEYMNEIEISSTGDIKLSKRLKTTGSRLAEEGGYLNTQLLTNSFLNAHHQKRINPEPFKEIHFNFAASIQKVLEHVVGELCLIAKERVQSDNLVLSGGVVMNSSLNGHILQNGKFNKIFPLPVASDRGLGLGAALYYIHQELKLERFFTIDHAFLGQEFDDKTIIKALKKAKLKYTQSKDVAGDAAGYLADGEIIGWFQGGSEIGARALGHRSILASPKYPEMKDIINKKVKHREWFRPFAPAAIKETARDYFTLPEDVANFSYMTFTVPATDKAATEAPAVVHVDKTARLQLIDSKHNGLYTNVVKRFGELTGTPVILNTSFNDKNEPIVETPSDAIKTFRNTDIDVLCMGNMIASKNLK